MALIPFTEYVLPHGRRRVTEVERPQEIADKAHAIIAAGNRLEAEVLTTGHVSFTVTNNDEGDWEIEVCRNGPDVLEAVDRLIGRAFAEVEKRASLTS